MCEWKDGSVYEGDWINENMCEKGRLIGANGSVYEGDFIDDKANGNGVYQDADG